MNTTIKVGKNKGERIKAFVCGHTGATGKALMDIIYYEGNDKVVLADYVPDKYI
jgi:hypothetical protein